jgi:hypothetical protein
MSQSKVPEDIIKYIGKDKSPVERLFHDFTTCGKKAPVVNTAAIMPMISIVLI